MAIQLIVASAEPRFHDFVREQLSSTPSAEIVSEHEEMIQAIINRDVTLADSLASAHADQIVGQIRSYITADSRQNATLTL